MNGWKEYHDRLMGKSHLNSCQSATELIAMISEALCDTESRSRLHQRVYQHRLHFHVAGHAGMVHVKYQVIALVQR